MKTISKLKKELDKWFSLFIRLRDATEYGLVQCFTCGIVKHYKSGMQCGHFQSRRFMATRYDEKNCSAQCVACNMFRAGEQYKFGLALDAKYGEGTAEELEIIARQTHKFSRYDYEIGISYYKSSVEKLKKEKGIE
jgi:hypothetical protein|tara:strand:- start:469 stop:876 length:408 start_codon:yes stop_codon:yes gene_type:complete